MRLDLRHGLGLAGGALVSLCDRMHMAGGVLTYPDGGLWGQPWWVPLLFGAAGVVLVAAHDLLVKALRSPPRPSRPDEVLLYGALFVAAYAATAFAPLSAPLLAVLLLALWLPAALAQRSAAFWVFAAALGLAGPLVEAALSSGDRFGYTQPDVLGVPMWLPVLYLWLAPLASALARLPVR
ncbi:MAG: hypothetical protein EYC70_12910 [Planctomycetota bacterium]|nr:MAG: hypothetical protein EYC70_12910 [Planctomycetota bacterium]